MEREDIEKERGGRKVRGREGGIKIARPIGY